MTASSPPPQQLKLERLPTAGGDCAYFFDIDGTLLEITELPTAVVVDRALQHIIEHLYAVTHGAVALISGRSIADIDLLFPEIAFPAAGQHGLERRNAAGLITRHPFPGQRLDEARRTLLAAVAQHPGLYLEDKGLSLALHYRQVPRLAALTHRTMRTIQSALGREYCVQIGKRVVEIKPAGNDKGMAILEFMRELPFMGRTPVFVGDDATDEFGFSAVNLLRGHSIKVGAGRTAASWRLPDVATVRAWLERGNLCGQTRTDDARGFSA